MQAAFMPIILDIKVIPRARNQLLKADNVYALRCYVKSPPEDNKANAEVIECIANALKVSKSSITIIAGATARIKRLQIEGFDSKDAVFKKMNLEVQNALF